MIDVNESLKIEAKNAILHQFAQGKILVYGSLLSDRMWVVNEYEPISSEEFLAIEFNEDHLKEPIIGFLNYEDHRQGRLDKSLIFRVIQGIEFNFKDNYSKFIHSKNKISTLKDSFQRNELESDFSQLPEGSIDEPNIHRKEEVCLDPRVSPKISSSAEFGYQDNSQLIQSEIQKTAPSGSKDAQSEISEGVIHHNVISMGPLDLLLSPIESDQQYLQKVENVIDQIRSGRFYQLNFLRRFHILNGNREKILQRWFAYSGAYGALVLDRNFELYSFSPEHFLSIKPMDGGFKIFTSPIKGTIERGLDPQSDKLNRENLTNSLKDRSELAMIVDLMRNDLRKISQPCSVEVTDPGSVKTFSTLHHLVAEISSVARNGMTISDMLAATFPSGSITGAPKIEVMKAIHEQENCPRDFFMGCAFRLETHKQFESTVMIRTVVKNAEQYLYAAGSGIVIKSEPEQELKEVAVKCRILTGVT